MTSPTLPTRWIACVDGTWCSPDGAYGNRHNNIGNIYRIYASIKDGECVDGISGATINQQKKYYNGLGSQKDIIWLKRWETGAFGTGFSDQIRAVYEDCCLIPYHPGNEIWLFGFSRGAFVVRAVASLLHHIRVLTSAGTANYDKALKSALRDYRSLSCDSEHAEVGHLHHLLSAHTREAPKIRFVGVFDTVKALDDRALYDISFNDSIQHVRHALALNEDRKAFKPKTYNVDPRLWPSDRSLVEAWFIGSHLDIGGSAAKDGLALYPLQWMLVESRAKGLVLECDGSLRRRARIDDPLKLVFPSSEAEGKGADMLTLTIANGLKVDMQDLRRIHALPEYGTRHAVHLNRSGRRWMRKKSRTPFVEGGGLEGYCEEVLPNEDIFWGEEKRMTIEAPGAIRILVCGNSGVGKSTLINEVFGAHLTEVSDRTRGQHDIRVPLQCACRPNLIIHDSGGFESGGDKEVQRVKDFIVEMAKITKIEDRLHMIWFCIETNSQRISQQATADFFTTLSQHSEIPIVIVQTKKDEFWDLQYGKARRQSLPSIAALDAFADEELRKRLISIEEDLSSIKNARYDDIVPVSKEDKRSIEELTEATARCFDNDHEKIRMLYVATQVARLDLKVDIAVIKTIQICQQVEREWMIPFSTYSTKHIASVGEDICGAIINAFGVPFVTTATARQIIKTSMGFDTCLKRQDVDSRASRRGSTDSHASTWSNSDGSYNLDLFLSECTQAYSIDLSYLAISGSATRFTAADQARYYHTLATIELSLTLSCNAILILRRAYHDCTRPSPRHPKKSDIEKAALAYGRLAQQIRQEIQGLMSSFNSLTAYLMSPKRHPISSKLQTLFEQILAKHTRLFVEQFNDEHD
ncbi:MAG: hypothetical protein Q9224_004268 [Gallowayella concinna]